MAVSIHGNNGFITTNGTAGAPSLAAPDTDTGFFFDTNTIKATTSGSERLRIDSSGRLLLGTTTEGFASYGDKFTIANSGHCGMTIRSGDTSDGNIYFSDGTSGADEVRGFVEYNHNGNTMNLGTNGGWKLRIDSNGHVGLGIAPSDVDSIGKALNIASSTGGAIYLQDTDAPTVKFGAISYNGATAALQIHAHHSSSYIDLGTNGTERLRLTSGVVASFGNSSPPAWANDTGYYNIQLGKTGFLRSDTDTSNTFMTIGHNGYKDSGGWKYAQNGGASSIFQQGGNIIFETAASGTAGNALTLTEKLRITSAGKIGINDSNPERTLDVVGNNAMIQIEGSGGNGRQYSLCSTDDTTGAAVGSAGQFVIYDDTSGAKRLNITSAGEVLIGRDAKPNDINKLVVTGTSPADAYDSQCHLEGSETSGAANTGGALAFAGHDGSAYRNWANIYGMKENGTGSNTAAYMSFHTRPAGGGPTERLRIQSTGQLLYSAASGDNTITSKRTNAAGSNGNYFFHLKATDNNDNNVGELGFHRDTAVDDSRFIVKTRNSGGSSTERLRINSTGKLLIGTTKTYYANDYYDDITINNSGGSGATGGTGITMISNSNSWGAVQFGDQNDDDCGYIKYDHNADKFIFGVEDGSIRFWLNKNKTWFGTTGHGDGSRSSLFDLVGDYQDPTGVWTQMGLYSSDSYAANKGGSIGFGGQDGSTARQQFAAIKGAKEDGTSGNYKGYMAFYTRPDGAVTKERWRITSDGQLNSETNGGMNIHGGNQHHSNDGVLYVDKSGNSDWALKVNAASASSTDYCSTFLTNNNASYAIAVYDLNNSTYRMRVNGNGVLYSTNTSVQSISDRRLKENIVDANSQWDDIKGLKFRNYKWKADSGYADGKTYLGLIADEVESVCPNLTSIDAQSKEDKEAGKPDPEYKAVNYSIVWMKAVKALQEAQSRIETLEAEVAALKGS